MIYQRDFEEVMKADSWGSTVWIDGYAADFDDLHKVHPEAGAAWDRDGLSERIGAWDAGRGYAGVRFWTKPIAGRDDIHAYVCIGSSSEIAYVLRDSLEFGSDKSISKVVRWIR